MDWFETTDPLTLLEAARYWASLRQLRLVMAGFLDTLPPQNDQDEVLMPLLKTFLVEGVDATEARARMSGLEHPERQAFEELAVRMVQEASFSPMRVAEGLLRLMVEESTAAEGGNPELPTLACELLREVLPPRPRPELSPVCRCANDRAVLRLAQSIDQSGSYEDLPILADALEEAGCTDQRILAHCRSGTAHRPGCWVIELILGRE